MNLEEDAVPPCGIESSVKVQKDSKCLVLVVKRMSVFVVEYEKRISGGGVVAVGKLEGESGV